MKTILMPRTAGTFLCLVLFCSCATENSNRFQLPADVKMNKDAGRGNGLFVTLRLESGEELPFELDTGTADTSIDKSLEPKLGERLDTIFFLNFGVMQYAGRYAAPRLYLGNTQLIKTGTNIVTYDRKQLSYDSPRPIMGILGMDVLQHYCIQLDFKAGIIRFLDDEHANKKTWGRPFPLTDIGDGCFTISDNLAGANGLGSLIDTGCDYDGWLTPELFQQWTNHATPPDGAETRFPTGVLGVETYPDLNLHRLEAELPSSGDSHMNVNGIGLRFLARHLVTFDFPNRKMYLKRTSVGPPVDEELKAAGTAAGKSAMRFLLSLKKKGQLAGWSKNDDLATPNATFHFRYPNSGTLDLVKRGDSSIYHYTVLRSSEDGRWQLRNAWRTDQKGRTIEDYSLP